MDAARVPTLQEIEAAAEALRRVAVRTPLLRCEALERLTGAREVRIKAECLQYTGSFKFRGAYWRCRQLSPEERGAGVVAYSSGNFAQGLAAAAQLAGVPATLVMPCDSPAIKRARTEAYEARVVLSEHGDRPREAVASEVARSLAERGGLVLLHPFDDTHIVAGHASAALEVLDELAEQGEAMPDAALCSVGGGGFVAGLAMGFHYRGAAMELAVAEPAGHDSFGRSLDAGHIIGGPGGRTVCDALQAPMPGAVPFACAQAAGLGARFTVSDRAVRQAMRVAFETLKLVLEPSGAASLAALLENPGWVSGRRVVVFATGGNISLDDFHALAGNPA